MGVKGAFTPTVPMLTEAHHIALVLSGPPSSALSVAEGSASGQLRGIPRNPHPKPDDEDGKRLPVRLQSDLDEQPETALPFRMPDYAEENDAPQEEEGDAQRGGTREAD